MANSAKEGFSKYIRLTNGVADLLFINGLATVFFSGTGLNYAHFCLYITVAWSTIAYFSSFYEVYRYTPLIKVVAKLVRQNLIFFITAVAYFPFNTHTDFNPPAMLLYAFTVVAAVSIFKIALYFYLKHYRIATGSNYRNVIILGYTPQAVSLRKMFDSTPEYGYRFKGYFSDMAHHPDVKGTLQEAKKFILAENIDEVYCSIGKLNNEVLKDFLAFADDNAVAIKFIPDTKDIFSKNLRVDYYEMFPVLTLRKTALHNPSAQLFKRFFDICFSLGVIVFVLSWLTPILAMMIKLESKGPVFFKQSRPGLDEREFWCYKFRSMQLNETTEKSVTRNDPRVTRIGKFIRKTSVDELPQFLNVLKGEMSIVGPRPHLWTQNNTYSSTIKKYMVRLYVKPGITGLAQVKGYRGEIATDEDMIHRIRYDVFYIENWSVLLDIKIIIQTVVNIFMGEEKAY